MSGSSFSQISMAFLKRGKHIGIVVRGVIHFIDNLIKLRIRPSIERKGGLSGGRVKAAMVQIERRVGVSHAGGMAEYKGFGNTLANPAEEIGRHVVGGIEAGPFAGSQPRADRRFEAPER